MGKLGRGGGRGTGRHDTTTYGSKRRRDSKKKLSIRDPAKKSGASRGGQKFTNWPSDYVERHFSVESVFVCAGSLPLELHLNWGQYSEDVSEQVT